MVPPSCVLTLRSVDLRKTLALAALACAIRPTNAVLWTYMFSWLLWNLRRRPKDVSMVLVNTMVGGYVGINIIGITFG